MTSSSSLIPHGIAATGALQHGLRTGPVFIVIPGEIGADYASGIGDIIAQSRIAPGAAVSAIIVDEDAGQALWIAEPMEGMLGDVLPLGDMETRLNAEMFAARPLLGARLHCMVAFQHGDWSNPNGKLERELDRAWNSFRSELLSRHQPEKASAGRNYYLPHLHPLLVPGAQGPVGGEILTLATSIFDGERVECRRRNRNPVAGRVEDVFLHLGPERSLLLEWVVTLDTAALEKDETRLWKTILANGVHGPDRSLAAWLDFSASTRVCYASFKPTNTEKESREAKLLILASSGADVCNIELYDGNTDDQGRFRSPIIGLVAHFLRQFVSEEDVSDLNSILEFRFDDRARVIQSVVVAGDEVADKAPNARERSICEARLLDVDGWDTTFPYDEDFSRKETYAYVYDRFRGLGSRYLVSDHSFAFIGHGCFALSDVWRIHMRETYPAMARLLQINGAILNGFSRELVAFGPDWKVEPPEDLEAPHPLAGRFSGLRGRYLRFLALNWVEQVSSQMQGVELYDLLRRASHAQRELGIVGDSIERAEAFFDQQARDRGDRLERRKEDMVRFLAAIVPVLGLGGLVLSMLNTEAPTGLARVLQGWANAWLIHAPGESSAQTWAYEIAGYVILLAMLALGAMGFLRTPLAEFSPTEKRAARYYFVPAAAIALAAPFLIHAITGPSSRIGALALCAGAVLAYGWAALPNAQQGGRKARKAVRWLSTAAITALTLIAGLHAATIP